MASAANSAVQNKCYTVLAVAWGGNDLPVNAQRNKEGSAVLTSDNFGFVFGNGRPKPQGLISAEYLVREMKVRHLGIHYKELYSHIYKLSYKPHMVWVVVRCKDIVNILDRDAVLLDFLIEQLKRSGIVGIEQNTTFCATDEVCICIAVFQFRNHCRHSFLADKLEFNE